MASKPKVDMTGVPAEYLSESGRYKPGHDAKHVSAILAELKAEAKATTKDGKIKTAAVRAAAKALPTPALRAKLEKAVLRFNEPPVKAAKPAADKADAEQATEEPADTDPEPVDESAIVRVEERQDVKVGRWFYPARTAFLEDGTEQIQRNEARDGSGAWVVYGG